MEDFNCEFDAPMFVDFESIRNEDETDHESAEAYFNVNHEDAAALAAADVEQPANLMTNWNGAVRPKEADKMPPLNACMKDTPKRKALRQAVTTTIKEITNSPKLEVPPKRRSPLKRLNNKPTSPGISRWQKVVRQMTPEIMKKARMERQLRKMRQEKERTEPALKSHLAGGKRFPAVSKPISSSSMASAAVSKAPKPLAPTNPAPFKFATDARIKPASKPMVAAGAEEVDFAKMLRSYQGHPSNAKASTGVCTKVQPFNLSGGARRRFHSAERDGSTMAEKVQRFQNGTPERFRSRPRFRSASPPSRVERGRSVSPTRSRAPPLLTSGRSRPAKVPSREQMEDQDLEEAKRHQFKARAVNEGIKLTKSVAVERKPSTVPKPFHFASHPSASRPAPPEEPSHDFHALPLNRKILDRPIGVPPAHPKPPVAPESPDFALKDRLKRKRTAVEEEEKETNDRIIVAKPAPQQHHGVPVLMQATVAKKATVAAPFSFEQRDIAATERKEKLIQSALEKEKKEREFKANPVPTYLNKPVNLPLKEVEEPTRSEPFDFRIEKRVEERLHKWQSSVEEELRKQREVANFKAKPAAVLERAPFLPAPSTKPLAHIEEFELRSERRAVDRDEFERRMKDKEAEMEAAKRRAEEAKRAEEEAQVARARKEAVHKAQPIKHYAPIHIHPSDKPITTAVSPKLSYKEPKKKPMNDTFDVVQEKK